MGRDESFMDHLMKCERTVKQNVRYIILYLDNILFISDRIFLFLASNKCNGDVGDILQNSNKTLNKLLPGIL